MLEPNQKMTGPIDSIIDTRQLISGPQRRLALYCGGNLPRGSDRHSRWPWCSVALSNPCDLPTRIGSERLGCLFVEMHPIITTRSDVDDICGAATRRVGIPRTPMIIMKSILLEVYQR